MKTSTNTAQTLYPWDAALDALGLPKNVEPTRVKAATVDELVTMATTTGTGDGEPFTCMLDGVRRELDLLAGSLRGPNACPITLGEQAWELSFRLDALVELHHRILSEMRAQARAERNEEQPRRARGRRGTPATSTAEGPSSNARTTPPAPESQVRATRKVGHG